MKQSRLNIFLILALTSLILSCGDSNATYKKIEQMHDLQMKAKIAIDAGNIFQSCQLFNQISNILNTIPNAEFEKTPKLKEFLQLNGNNLELCHKQGAFK